ncbi:MAG: L-seryl-tRNA(Ser) seleniumtransferase [Pirellulaceae bacterium]|jgi:L-seryl-tRNA(Ser) seleniumtransferase
MGNVLRNIPSVNDLLESPPLRRLVDRANRTVVVSGIRKFLENFRSEVHSAAAEINVPTVGELAETIADWILNEEQLPLRPVVNATGILLHTGLGRAPLAEAAIEAIARMSAGYASVEIDLETGKRSQRVVAVEKLLRQVTGAEAAFVVNNNAGATLIALAAVAGGREVIVSRGQLIEIGGSFRLPDVMSASGTVLREVGTTNKTRVEDYRDAITQDTAALMRVHTSNFVVEGFTAEASLEELIDLGKKRNLPVIDDIGSGALVDFKKYGVDREPVASHSVKAGADLVLFSGDKLMGGPQCGIIVGNAALIEKIRKHPLARALRVDKIVLAALAATLNIYRDPANAERYIPLLQLLSASEENLKNRAERLAPQLESCNCVAAAEVLPDTTFLGGGSVPTQRIPTWTVALTPAKITLDTLSYKLRTGTPAVLGRIHKDQLILDLRSVLPNQDRDLIQAVASIGEG